MLNEISFILSHRLLCHSQSFPATPLQVHPGCSAAHPDHSQQLVLHPHTRCLAVAPYTIAQICSPNLLLPHRGTALQLAPVHGVAVVLERWLRHRGGGRRHHQVPAQTHSGAGEPPEHRRCAHADGGAQCETGRPAADYVDHGSDVPLHQLWHRQQLSQGLFHCLGELCIYCGQRVGG